MLNEQQQVMAKTYKDHQNDISAFDNSDHQNPKIESSFMIRETSEPEHSSHDTNVDD